MNTLHNWAAATLVAEFCSQHAADRDQSTRRTVGAGVELAIRGVKQLLIGKGRGKEEAEEAAKAVHSARVEGVIHLEDVLHEVGGAHVDGARKEANDDCGPGLNTGKTDQRRLPVDGARTVS